MLPWTGGGVDHLNGQPWVSLSFGGRVGPVGLCDLLPHDHVEASAGLVAKHEASVVVISLGVDEKGAAEIHCVEFIKTWKWESGVNILIQYNCV